MSVTAKGWTGSIKEVDMKQVRVRKRSVVRTLVILLALGLLALPSAGFGQIAAEPRIALLNPSDYSTAGERGIIVSDRVPDAGPNCCAGANESYRLSAWVSDPPVNSSVFFLVTQTPLEFEVPAQSQVSTGAYSAEWDIPAEMLDGPATVSAFLVVNNEVIATDEVDVTILRFQENVTLTYPRPAGEFGTYSALANALPEEGAAERRAPAGVVEALWTDTLKMAYVRTFYTTSPVGSAPEWKVCGTELISASGAGNGVRCSLEDPAEQSAITAIAAVANDSPDDYEVRFNESGDVVTVSDPYAQSPNDFSLGGNVGQVVDKEARSGRFFCSGNQEVTLKDERGRQIVGANIDVHAEGPDDSLKFHTFSILTVNKPPDRGTGHTTEPGYDCTGQSADTPPANANPATQGEHQRFGAPDRKHIESLNGGTNDLGMFSFRLHANSAGPAFYTVWVDETDDGCLTNDDNLTLGELNVVGGVGFGQPPGAPLPATYEASVPCVPGEGPAPEPTPSPEEPNRKVGLRLVTKDPSRGDRILLRGRIRSEERSCVSLQQVVLKARRPGGRFYTIAREASSSEGRFRFQTTVNRKKDLRAVVEERSACDRVRSRVVRVRF